jgi:hypothetical protein
MSEQTINPSLLEKAKRIKEIKIEILDLQSKKKKIDQEMNLLKEEKQQLESELLSYLTQNKKSSLDLKVLNLTLKSTSTAIVDDFISHVKDNMTYEINIKDQTIQELVEQGAVKIDITITPNKDMLKTLCHVMTIPRFKVEVKQYVDIR